MGHPGQKEAFPGKLKVPKHLIEKKRRQRINKCLGELKQLVIDKDLLQGQQSSKLEKADILELTVDYLKRKTTPSYPANEVGNKSNVHASPYVRGYMECVQQVSRHLKHTDVKQSVSEALLEKLETVAQTVSSYDEKSKTSPDKTFQGSEQTKTNNSNLNFNCTTTIPQLSNDSSKDISDGTFHISSGAKEKECSDDKMQISSSTDLTSTCFIREQSQLSSASIKMLDKHRVPHQDVQPICPVAGGIQSVTVLIPCQVSVLASAIPSTSNTQIPGHNRSRTEHTCPLTNPSDVSRVSNALSVNQNYVSVKSVTQDVCRRCGFETVPPIQSPWRCGFETVPPIQSPWRPW